MTEVKLNGEYIGVFKQEESRWSNGTTLFVGKIPIASYDYNGMRPKDDPKCYIVRSTLPTVKPDLGSFITEEECKQKCIQVANFFLRQLTVNL